ncbi:hypothetical protein Micbo1qcDRAFT_167611, partial [Microdochium bolleyi]
MNHIYSLASGVIAWVGMDELNGLKAFEIMRHLVLGAARTDEDSDSDTDDDDDAIGRLTKLTSRDHEILDSFFCRSYWTRLWIVQELVLATKIQFVCEDAYLPWPVVHQLFAPNDSIAKGGSIFRALPFALQMNMWRARHLWASRQIRGDEPRSPPSSSPISTMGPSSTQLNLLQLLNKFNPCRCLLPKDYIYALLGMCSDPVRELIVPDYTAGTTDQAVFQAATAACILEQQNLNVLALLRRFVPGCPDEPDALPPPLSIATASSWAGEWSTVRIIRPIVEPDDAVQMFQAATAEVGGRKTVFTSEHNMRFAQQGVLALSGVVVDTLGVVEEEVYPYASGWEESLRSWEPDGLRGRAYKSFAAEAGGEVAPESALQAYVRTLLLDSGYTIRAPKHGRMTADQITDRRELYERWASESRAAAAEEETVHGKDDFKFPQCLKWGTTRNFLHGWTFGTTTQHGLFVRTHPDAEVGDMIVLLRGSPVPIVLRQVEDRDHSGAESLIMQQHGQRGLWRIIGSAYVHGIMDGEYWAGLTDDEDMEFLI